MNRPSTAKEALIAEALGDLDLLLKRLEAVVPLVDSTRKTLIKSSETISREIATFAPHMKEFTDYAKIQTAKQIDRSVVEVTQRAKEAQLQSMQEAAREMFKKEVDPVVRQVLAQLQQIAQQRDHPFDRWATYAMAFCCGCLLTVVVLTWVR